MRTRDALATTPPKRDDDDEKETTALLLGGDEDDAMWNRYWFGPVREGCVPPRSAPAAHVLEGEPPTV